MSRLWLLRLAAYALAMATVFLLTCLLLPLPPLYALPFLALLLSSSTLLICHFRPALARPFLAAALGVALLALCLAILVSTLFNN